MANKYFKIIILMKVYVAQENRKRSNYYQKKMINEQNENFNTETEIT